MSNRLESKIEYEQLPAGGGITRRQGRWLIILLILNTMLLAVGVVGPQIGPAVRKQIDDYFARRAAAKAAAQQAVAIAQQRQQLVTQQSAWMAFDFPPNTVVYEEDPKLAAAHLISGKGYRVASMQSMPDVAERWQPPVIAPHPPTVAQFAGRAYLSSEGILFLHEPRTPGGRQKLLAVFLHATQTGHDQRQTLDKRVETDVRLAAVAFEPVRADSSAPDLNSLPRWKEQTLDLRLPAQSGVVVHYTTNTTTGPYELRELAHLRLFGGSPDANDPSHFTIPYQLGARRGTIEGWLREDGIEIRGREGEMGAQSSWNLPPP